MKFFEYGFHTKIKNGFQEVLRHRYKLAILLGYLFLWLRQVLRHRSITAVGLDGFIERGEWCLLVLVGFVGGFVLLILLGIPIQGRRIQSQLREVSFYNSAGKTPILLKEKKCGGRKRIWVFDNSKIPLEQWLAKIPTLETALNISIESISYGDSMREIEMVFCPVVKIPSQIVWKDTLLSPKEFEWILGESRTGTVSVNLADIPHLLIGGSTGSGKTVLTKLLIWQAMQKGADVFIADFKGGMDYSGERFHSCRLYTNREELSALLEKIEQEIEHRKRLLREAHCSNISQYNQIYGEQLRRKILFLDELAEILDKHGLEKEEAAVVKKMERVLSSIARGGRAVGVHLVISMQRPDAEVLIGQIKNNIDFRVCGRADSTLSRIILDDGAAAKKIPKDAKGLFLTNEGVLFRAYYLDEGYDRYRESEEYIVSLDCSEESIYSSPDKTG